MESFHFVYVRIMLLISFSPYMYIIEKTRTLFTYAPYKCTCAANPVALEVTSLILFLIITNADKFINTTYYYIQQNVRLLSLAKNVYYHACLSPISY